MLKLISGPMLALSVALFSVPAFAADAMSSSANACSATAIHSAAASTASQIDALKSTGDADKDYAACGKDSKTMKMAEKAHGTFGQSYQDFAALKLGG